MSAPLGRAPLRVAVLGGGVAGLRAAHALREQGHAVRLFEARERLGGRVTGARFGDGWLDTTWPVLGGRDEALARWASALGLGDAMWPLRPVQATLLHGGETRPIDPASLSAAARLPGLSLYERTRLLRFTRLLARHAPKLDADRPELSAPLDDRSLAEHVALYFGRGPLERWLGPEVQAFAGDDFESLSRVVLLQHARNAGLGARRPGQPGLPRRPLVELLETAAESLHVHLGTAVDRVDEEPAGGFRLEATDGGGRREEAGFDAVVIALGPREAFRVGASMWTPPERRFFEDQRMRTSVTLSLVLEGVRTGLPQEIRLPRSDGEALASVLLEPGPMEGRIAERQSHLVAVVREDFAAKWADVTDDVVEKVLLRAVESVVPDVAPRIQTARVCRAELPFFEVGHFRRLERFRRVQADRRALGRGLYFAGDYLAGPSFEAACRSGLRAARELEADRRGALA